MSIQSIFANPVSGPPTKTRKEQAVAGFTQVFAAILSKELRSTGTGENEGPVGTGGGTAGDIYGSFFDQAMAHVLANSPAIKPLNQAIERELERPRHPSGTGNSNLHPSGTMNDNRSAVVSGSDIRPASILTRNSTDLDLSSDSRGPVLLPPEPTGVASVLPPPPRLEG